MAKSDEDTQAKADQKATQRASRDDQKEAQRSARDDRKESQQQERQARQAERGDNDTATDDTGNTTAAGNEAVQLAPNVRQQGAVNRDGFDKQQQVQDMDSYQEAATSDDGTPGVDSQAEKRQVRANRDASNTVEK